MDPNQPLQKCGCVHHKMTPILIVVLGLVFLLGSLGVLSPLVANTLWPIVIILIGLQKLFGHKCKCCAR